MSTAQRPDRRAGVGHNTSPDYPNLNDEKAAIKAALADQALAFVRDGLGYGKPSFITRSEARWGKNGSFKLFLNFKSRGLWHDHEAGGGGDLLALIQREKGYGFVDAIRFARDWLGWGNSAPLKLRASAERLKHNLAKAERDDGERRREEERRSQYARKIWEEATDLLGSPGEFYLRDTRRITFDGPLPPSIRWHEPMHVLVFAITNAGGRIDAVQTIAINPDGSRDNSRWTNIRNGKKTNGQMGDGYVVFPSRDASDRTPVIYAEGPETALTLWAATGYETRAVLGVSRFNIMPATAPRNRRVIVARDDDAKSSGQAFKQVSKAVADTRAAGVDIVEVFPNEHRREDKSDFNDLCRENGIAAVKDAINCAIKPGASLAAIKIDLATGRERLAKRFAEFKAAALKHTTDKTPPVHATKVTVGVGKTHDYINTTIDMATELRDRGDDKIIAALVDKHALSDELRDRYMKEIAARGLDLSVDVWRGREAIGPDGKTMCADIETVREAERLHVDIEKEICKPCPHHPDNGGSCRYLLQRGRSADIWIGAHNLIFNRPPTPIGKKDIAAVVIDEGIIQAGLIGIDSNIDIAIDALDAFPVPDGEKGEKLAALRQKVKLALRDEPEGWVRIEVLKAAGVTAADANAAEKFEWDRKVGPKQTKDWRDRKDNATIGRAVTLWRAISSALTGDIEFSGRIEIARDREGVKVLRLSGRKDPHHKWTAPTLIVDATLDITLLREYWPTARNRGEFDIATPHQHVTQVIGKSFAKSKLRPASKPKGEPDDEALAQYAANDRKAEKNRRDLHAIITREHIRAGSTQTLVVGNKVVIEAMSAAEPGSRYRTIEPGIDAGWFNAVAGIDRWKQAGLIIVVGRPLPPPRAVERMAGALTGVAPASTGGGWYPRVDGWRSVRGGQGEIRQVRAEVEQHPDPMAERFRHLICAGQIEQALGRGRGVNRTAADPLRVIILGDSVAPVPVDEMLDADKFAPSTIDLQLAAGGVAFEDGASASTAYPQLWASAGAYRVAAHREREAEAHSVTFSGKYSLTRERNAVVAPVTFQLPGERRRPQRAYCALSRIADPRAAIEALLGATLANFRMDDPALPGDAAGVAYSGA